MNVPAVAQANSIRPAVLVSLRVKGETQVTLLSQAGMSLSVTADGDAVSPGETPQTDSPPGGQQVVGDGRDGRFVAVNKGDLPDSARASGAPVALWFSLIDKVYAAGNLAAALTKVCANRGAAGVDHVSVEQFHDHATANLRERGEQLRQGSYQPQSIRRVYLPKPGSTEERPLGIPTVRDRVVQAALVNVLGPIFERDFAPPSCGFRPGRGAQQALTRGEALLAEGHGYVVDADLKSYFDTIPPDRLLQRIRDKVADGRLLRLIESFLQAGIFEGLHEWTPPAGAPQGAVLSPLLSNVYLDPLDHRLANSGFEMVRYADDFVILCRTRAEAERALEVVRAWVAANGLTLYPDKTRLVEAATEPFDFLGYRFDGGRRWLRPKSRAQLKENVRGKTTRTDGRSLACIITDLNRTLKGWFVYFRRCESTLCSSLDGWIRRRLRSLLRKRQGRKGISRHGGEERRWPKVFFAEQGLFSLKAAPARYVNPL